MDKEKWSEEKIEKMLSQVPNPKDNRSIDEVYTRLKNDKRLQDQQPIERKSWKWMPIAVTIAAVLLLGILTPSMLKDSQHQSDQVSESTFMQMDESADELAEVEKSIEEAALFQADKSSHLLLADELDGYIPFQIGLVSRAHVIPVTFLIPSETIQVDFQKENPNSVELYQKYAGQLREEALGFDAYHPFEGEIIAEEGMVRHKLPSNHSYDRSSASIQVYEGTIRSTFNDFSKVLPVQENGDAIEFSQVGTMDAIQINHDRHAASYYKYTLPSGQTYIVPQDAGEFAETVEEALLNMKKQFSDDFESLVPESVHYDVQVVEDTVFIQFKDLLDLSQMNDDEARLMIEGFMLTAEQFQLAIKLENVMQENFGKYDLSEALPRPVASNPVDFITE
ncbi:hypothetical protein [Sporosarcina pasteurii]|uniref:Sigma-X negative effector n=1 Tax=Sporosarcina pasteurii TaxID=1474 RepID=A0A380BLC0_SPOPA|nr:hypothetical protein [Sporosarcina pasteurii]MDS9470795.1 hypothetical protein [Sporosarcina pasteurii]QBQ05536.1 hypothetical protein E2C16_07580 [Sporosarcina pasteurii]SUJ02314.1 Sigma-X negative effector [Sporosarcina pasteurii]